MNLQDARFHSNTLTRDLMEYKALRKDNEINNRLLKELVMKYAAAEQELSILNRELVRKQDLLEKDLEAAAFIQQALLPKMPTSFESFISPGGSSLASMWAGISSIFSGWMMRVVIWAVMSWM